MSFDRVLVLGVAKTGTTIISKTVQNSLGIARYLLEPKTATEIEAIPADGDMRCVVKILFDHWIDRPRTLNGLLHNEFAVKFDKCILITRDPLGEFVSRMHYVAYPYFSQARRAEAEKADWVAIFEQLETDPDFGITGAVFALRQRFGVDLEGDLVRAYSARFADYISHLKGERFMRISYEDFMAGKYATSEQARLFRADRNVGTELSRTHRSDDPENWKMYVRRADMAWISERFGSWRAGLGYDSTIVPSDDRIPYHNCSAYVAGLISQA